MYCIVSCRVAWRGMSWAVLSSRFGPYRVVSCRVVSCRVVSCRAAFPYSHPLVATRAACGQKGLQTRVITHQAVYASVGHESAVNVCRQMSTASDDRETIMCNTFSTAGSQSPAVTDCRWRIS